MLCSTTVCLESKTTKITRCIFTSACVAFLSGAWFESRICADPTLVWNPPASRNVLKSMLTTAGLCFVPVLGLSLLDPSQGRGVRTLPGAVWEIFWILMSRIWDILSCPIVYVVQVSNIPWINLITINDTIVRIWDTKTHFCKGNLVFQVPKILKMFRLRRAWGLSFSIRNS